MMKTKTCPHCNEVAIAWFSMNVRDAYGHLLTWNCESCHKIFYTKQGDEDESI